MLRSKVFFEEDFNFNWKYFINEKYYLYLKNNEKIKIKGWDTFKKVENFAFLY